MGVDRLVTHITSFLLFFIYNPYMWQNVIGVRLEIWYGKKYFSDGLIYIYNNLN